MKINPIGPNQTEVSGYTQADKPFVILYSYQTPVAIRCTDGTFYQTEKKWSKTTSRHVSQWLRKQGAKNAETKPQSFFDNL